MTWHYRLILHDGDLRGLWIGLHEVYFEGDTVTGWTEDAVAFQCDAEEGPEGLIRSLEQALRDARERPMLRESDLPSEPVP